MESRMSKRLTKDLEAIQKHHKDTFIVEMPTKDIKLWHVKFKGAPKTLYAGEEYK
jgi:ubiquitin-protein ligase